MSLGIAGIQREVCYSAKAHEVGLYFSIQKHGGVTHFHAEYFVRCSWAFRDNSLLPAGLREPQNAISILPVLRDMHSPVLRQSSKRLISCLCLKKKISLVHEEALVF